MPPTKGYTVADLLKDELGIAPAKNVIYNPFCLNALAKRLHSEAYGDYIGNMRTVRETIDMVDGGKALLIKEGGGAASCETDLDVGQWEGSKVMKRVLSAYGGGCTDVDSKAHVPDIEDTTQANRHLPPALQQLGGIVLRPQGDTERGYVIPTVVLHYATGMAQMAEMYGEDMGADFEASGAEEWVCRPSEWEVGTAGVGPTLRELLKRVSISSKATEDGVAMPMLAIDANTTSAETLELIAAYCAALAAEHVVLDRQGTLNTDALPVFPTMPAKVRESAREEKEVQPNRTIALEELEELDIDRPVAEPETPRIQLYDLMQCDPVLELPISPSIPQPFSYLASAALLPPSSHSEMPVIMSKIQRQAGDKFRVVSRLTSLIQHRWSDLPRFTVVNATPTTKESQAAQALEKATSAIATNMLATGKRFKAPLQPLEAVFALEHLLPPLHGKHSPSSVQPPKEWCVADILKQEEFKTMYQALRKLPALQGAARDTLATFGTFHFDGNHPCGEASDKVCGGYQVEPRLGFIPYMKGFLPGYTVGYIGPPSYIPPFLRCTLDQFIDNAEAKAQRLVSMMDEGVWKQDSKPLDMGLICYKVNANSTSRTGMDEAGCYFVHDATTKDMQAMHDFRRQCGLTRKASVDDTSRTTSALSTGTSTLQVPLHSPEDTAPEPTATQDKTTSPKLDYTAEEEYALIRASLARTTDVMKVANFLGMAPLVNLCGLVIAILLRGKSLNEVRDMFTDISKQ